MPSLLITALADNCWTSLANVPHSEKLTSRPHAILPFAIVSTTTARKSAATGTNIAAAYSQKKKLTIQHLEQRALHPYSAILLENKRRL